MSETVGPYEIEATVRVDLPGRVVRARHTQLGRTVLLKELSPPPGLPAGEAGRLLDVFQQESAALVGVTDPRVARPVDAGFTATGTAYLAFEDPEGAGFRPLPDDPRASALDAWLEIGIQAGEALGSLSKAGVCPGALDPACLYAASSGELRYVHLSFTPLAIPSTPLPRSPHTAPEVAGAATATPAALVFSLGAWLYRALSGDPAAAPALLIAGGGTPEPLWRRNPEASSALDSVLQRALSRDPRRRHAGPEELARALGRCRGSPAAVPPRDAAAASEVTILSAPPPQYPWWEYALWIAGMSAAGGAAGWGLAQAVPPPWR